MDSALACANCGKRFANLPSYDYHIRRRGRGTCASVEKLGYSYVEYAGEVSWWKPGTFRDSDDWDTLIRPWAEAGPATRGGKTG